MRDPREIWLKMNKSYQAVSGAAIDAKLTELQSVQMMPNEPVIQYSNNIDNFVNELAATGHTVTNLEKKRVLLRGLRDEFLVMWNVFRSTEKEYDEAVSQLIIQESRIEETNGSDIKALLTTRGNRQNWKHDRKRPSMNCYTSEKSGHLSKTFWKNPEGNNYHPRSKKSR